MISEQREKAGVVCSWTSQGEVTRVDGIEKKGGIKKRIRASTHLLFSEPQEVGKRQARSK